MTALMQPRQIVRPLLAWFNRHARPLPWRNNRDPYRIWISEVMLQQTQVKTVIPYFHRFLQAFPTLNDLADADEQAILRMWEGLGYYRRARALGQAGRLLRDQGYATVPDDPELLRTLPGFGRYTANAVLSQAYDRRLPILEANSERVLCRLFGVTANPKSPATRKQLWQYAESLVPARSAGAFNQAIMELGALVCTPRAPNCSGCPIKRHCIAAAHGRQESIPARSRSAATERVEEVAIVVRRGNRYLLVQRPPRGRWAGLWEFPHHELLPGESHESAAARMLATLGLGYESLEKLGTIKHQVTRFSITLVGMLALGTAGSVFREGYAAVRWPRHDELAMLPLSSPQRRLANLVLEHSTQGLATPHP
jgi:A/G-specific adenine glycosylase